MDDDKAKAEESSRVAAEWRVKAAMTKDPACKQIMQQLATDYEMIARSWFDIAHSKQQLAKLESSD